MIAHAKDIHSRGSRFIKLPEVKAMTSLSTTEIYRRIAAGTFPAQVHLGPKSSVWVESEIIDWINAKVRARCEELVANASLRQGAHQ